VVEIFVKEGEDVKIGQKILTIDIGVSGESSAKEERPKEAEPPRTEAAAPPPFVPTPPKIESDESDYEKADGPPSHGPASAASPTVRRLARELGVDITKVSGSAPGGRISRDDVKAFVKKVMTSGGPASGGAAPAQRPLPDFSQWGQIRKERLSHVRGLIADGLTHAWQTIPHVTQFDEADITELEKFRKKYALRVEEAGGKLTVTAILMIVLASALKKFPMFNASIDLQNRELIYKDYYHIAVAVDTDRGLLVPVVRDVDKKSITDLSVELTEMAKRTRAKKITPDELEGGTFTISNQGGIGGANFTPIVYWPQVAILGVSRSRLTPRYVDGLVEPAMILPLSLSYDHRVIDGADAARFLSWVVDALEHPLLLDLEK
jgi:pyruvate dehydrogenase E2 component (dihydrolipoamide acetyltransferase)